MTGSLTERYDDRIAGVLSCYDRVVVTGTLPTVCYAAGLTKFLYAIGVRIFDYPQFASTLRERVRERAASLAAEAGITIEHIAKSHIRKEAVVADVLKRRGEHPGLVHVISAMEACGAYQTWHDKQTHKTFVRPDSGKCLHYYFYFKISPQLAQEIGSQFSTRIEGTCIKHRFASSSIKMYDKHGCVLRIETTINDVSFFKHHRKVEHRQGPPTRVLAPVKKTIYSLIDLREIMFGCNRRYLAHLAALDDFSAGVRALDRLTKPRTVEQKTLKGINFFDPVDHALLHALQNPRVNIAGIRRADLLPLFDQLSPDRLSRQLRRLRDLGVIKRVAGTYRYYLTRIGRAATAALCRVTQTVIIPALA